MGPNQFFNADLKDRAIFLVAALTEMSASWECWQRWQLRSFIVGEPVYASEDPFNFNLNKGGKPKIKKYSHYESIHYFNYGQRPPKIGKKMFTGEGHMLTPTKLMGSIIQTL